MTEGMGRVTDPCHPDMYWQAQGVQWWQRALTGNCVFCEIPVSANIEDDGIRFQHGPSSEHSRWFSVENLNQMGLCIADRESWLEWLRQIHVYEEGGQWLMQSGGQSSGSGQG